MKTILAATGNAHKVEEITAILKPLGIKVLSFKDIDMELPEVGRRQRHICRQCHKKSGGNRRSYWDVLPCGRLGTDC